MQRSEIVSSLKQLKMHGMAAAFEDLLSHGTAPKTPEDLFTQLLQAEMSERDVRSIAYQMKTARFPAYRDFTGFDFSQSSVDEA